VTNHHQEFKNHHRRDYQKIQLKQPDYFSFILSSFKVWLLMQDWSKGEESHLSYLCINPNVKEAGDVILCKDGHKGYQLEAYETKVLKVRDDQLVSD
jgi:hypothetical protein